ncbi:4'-phosphopantetheinyl transferase family protein [Chitinophaga sp. 22321]|uniref:4-phosphopantetheinyl transferase family protein n=1 Tax=Chitinophaga hostae TaxID=2831022 RepID=A0ABS5JC05_9BACT|nr:4'-phosphopantetheinyl transferase superfamily protein [Chitinophaga hostae]MBS0031992.1 4-phosphopantetheinyl transferase family protein [Chitinophaga hostae]
MIGNDIVDLALAAQESNIHRRGFIDKLFLLHEKEMIATASQPSVMVWLLWSCKEAVYKIVHRATGERKFAPWEFACRLSSSYDDEGTLPREMSGRFMVSSPASMSGIVVHQEQTYYFQSRIIHDYIHTYAAVSPLLLAQMRVFAGSYAVAPSILPSAAVLYKDESGIPYILDRETGIVTPVSLSHHGKYFGMANMP